MIQYSYLHAYIDCAPPLKYSDTPNSAKAIPEKGTKGGGLILDLSLLLNNGCLIRPLSEKVIIILPRFSPIIKNR